MAGSHQRLVKRPKAIESPLLGILIIASIAYGFLSPNTLETIWTGFALWLTLRLFWWQRTPGILLFALVTPFIEAHGVILEANNFGATLDEVYPGVGRDTFWASSIGYVAVLLGFYWGGRGAFNTLPSGQRLLDAAAKLNFNRIFIAVLFAQFIVQVTQQIIPYGSSFRQIEVYISGISLTATMALTCHHFIRKERMWLFYAFFAYFFITSFYSYFSSWRTPITLLITASMVTITEFRGRQVLRQAPIIASGIFLVFVWQTVKGEYREFLSQGERSQAIRVSQTEALNKFSELATDALQKDTLLTDQLIDATYKRVGYTEYFAAVIGKVPNEIPFEQGKLLSESIEFALIPRIINPHKGVKDDKAKVERYTDYYFGANSFSSFSLGHYCEAYIDWGPFWMHLHLFVYGLFGALLMRLTVQRTAGLNDLLKWGILFTILSGWGTFQQDMVTVLGRTVWGTACQLFLFIPIYTFIDRLCRKN